MFMRLLKSLLFWYLGYPEDEAASYDMLVYRHTEAPELFIGCYILCDLVGVSMR